MRWTLFGFVRRMSVHAKDSFATAHKPTSQKQNLEGISRKRTIRQVAVGETLPYVFTSENFVRFSTSYYEKVGEIDDIFNRLKLYRNGQIVDEKQIDSLFNLPGLCRVAQRQQQFIDDADLWWSFLVNSFVSERRTAADAVALLNDFRLLNEDVGGGWRNAEKPVKQVVKFLLDQMLLVQPNETRRFCESINLQQIVFSLATAVDHFKTMPEPVWVNRLTKMLRSLNDPKSNRRWLVQDGGGAILHLSTAVQGLRSTSRLCAQLTQEHLRNMEWTAGDHALLDRLACYAYSWLRLSIDPDVELGSPPGNSWWSDWYKVFENTLARLSQQQQNVTRQSVLRTVYYPVAVAAYFGEANDNAVYESSLANQLKSTIQSELETIIQTEKLDATTAIDLTDAIYNFGQGTLASQNFDKSPEIIKITYDRTFHNLMNVFIVTRPLYLGHLAMQRLLTGFRFMVDEEPLSDSFIKFLSDWFTEISNADKMNHLPLIDVCDSMATIIYSLKENLQKHKQTKSIGKQHLSSIAKAYGKILKGINQTATKSISFGKLHRIVCYFGDAYCNFGYHPLKSQEDVWTLWFDVVKIFLEEVDCLQTWNGREAGADVLTEEQFRKAYVYLLSVILDVVVRFHRFDDLKSMQSVWEQRAAENAAYFSKRNRYIFCQRLANLQKQQEIQFELTMLNEMARQGKRISSIEKHIRQSGKEGNPSRFTEDFAER